MTGSLRPLQDFTFHQCASELQTRPLSLKQGLWAPYKASELETRPPSSKQGLGAPNKASELQTRPRAHSWLPQPICTYCGAFEPAFLASWNVLAPDSHLSPSFTFFWSLLKSFSLNEAFSEYYILTDRHTDMQANTQSLPYIFKSSFPVLFFFITPISLIVKFLFSPTIMLAEGIHFTCLLPYF